MTDYNIDQWEEKYTAGLSVNDIAEDHEVSAATVSRYLQKRGVDVNGSSKYDDLISEWVCRYESGEPTTEIAEGYEASPSTVARLISAAGVEIKKNTSPSPPDLQYEEESKEWIDRFKSGKSISSISESVQASYPTVRKYIRRAGLETQQGGDYPVSEWVDLYTQENLTAEEIAKEYDVSDSKVLRSLRQEDVDTSPGPSKHEIDDWECLYINENLTIHEIADRSEEWSPTTVCKYLNEKGVETEDPTSEEYAEKRSEWKQRFLKFGETAREISRDEKVSKSTVTKYLRQTGVDTRNGNREMEHVISRYSTRHGDDTQCWVWQARTNKGYGRIVKNNEGRIPAHRASYREFCGSIPEGHVIRHRCDNPPCVNPNHLEVGTREDNLNDIYQHREDFSSLTPKEIIQIAKSEEENWIDLAEKYGVRVSVIRHILETSSV